jgi:WD40 repeat protein
MLVGGNSTILVENLADQYVTQKVEAKLAEMEGVKWLDDATYNSDRTLIAAARRDNVNESHPYWVSIYDAATSEVLARIPHNEYVQKVLFDHDGKDLFSLSWDNTEKIGIIRQWDVAQAVAAGELSSEDGRIIFENSPDVQFTYTSNMALSPDGNILAVTVRLRDDNPYSDSIQLVDIENNTLLTKLELGGYILDDGVPRGSGETWDTTIQSIVFSQDSRLLIASGCGYERSYECHRGSLHAWDIATGESLFAKSTHHDQVTVALNQDNTLLATGSYDGTIRLWGVPVEQATP